MKTDFHPQRTARFLGRTDGHILVRFIGKNHCAPTIRVTAWDRLLAGLNVLDLGPRSCSRRDRRRHRYSRHREWRAAVSFSRPSPRPDRARPARGSFCSSRRPRSRWRRRRQPSQGRPSPGWRDRSAIFDSRRSMAVVWSARCWRGRGAFWRRRQGQVWGVAGGFPAALPCDQSGSPWLGDGIKAFLDAVASP
jgi:hypothetical protein